VKTLIDRLAPRGESVRFVLKKGGRPVAAVHIEDSREFRSPTLEKVDADPKRTS
jgi:hypothetical protein